MNDRSVPSATAVTVFALILALFPLAGCGAADDDDGAGSGGGSAAGSGGTRPGGSGGLGPAGTSSAGMSGAAAAGASGAGTSGAVAAGASGAGVAGGGGTIPATFATVKLVLGGGGGIMPCSAAPCHGVNGMAPPARPLELPPTNDQQLYANLTSYVSAACNGTKLVTPGNPNQSALLSILKGPCGMTPRMPFGCSAEAGDCIPDEYIAAVAQWITAGAPP